eukprot:gene7757-940_t
MVPTGRLDKQFGRYVDVDMAIGHTLEKTAQELTREKDRLGTMLATSATLEKTAQELTREKDRLDTMLVSQYELLNCFSMKSMATSATLEKTAQELTREKDRLDTMLATGATLEKTAQELTREKDRLDTMLATGATLEKTAQELTREKDRLDTMLVRQYELLNCCSMKSMAKVSGCRRLSQDSPRGDTLTVDSVEEARVRVNKANNSNTGRDMLEIGQLLGEGADMLEIVQLLGEGADGRDMLENGLRPFAEEPEAMISGLEGLIEPFAEESGAFISGLDGLIEALHVVCSPGRKHACCGTSGSPGTSVWDHHCIDLAQRLGVQQSEERESLQWKMHPQSCTRETLTRQDNVRLRGHKPAVCATNCLIPADGIPRFYGVVLSNNPEAQVKGDFFAVGYIPES